MLKLAIFDIDGTLINSNKVDEACFAQAVEESFGIRNIDTRWEHYKDATDGAIFEEIFQRHFDRKPSGDETRKMIEKFVALLRGSYERNPILFQEIDGAGQMLRMLARHPQWKPTIATGAWRESALFKLQAAGLDVTDIPLATSSDAHSREAIIHRSISAAKEFFRVGAFDKIVSIGDAVWDMRTARKLGIPFIKIGKPALTGDCDTKYMLDNFCESTRLFEYMDRATV